MLPAQDGVDRPLLEEGCRPSEAPAAAPTHDPEQGLDWPRVLTLNWPSRTQILPLSPLSGANPRDGPAAARLRPADWRNRRNPAGSDRALARTRERYPPGPSEPGATVRWQRIDASARSRTRWRWPIEFLYPTGRLEGRPCDLAEECTHTETRLDAGSPDVPYQMDYLFASRVLAERLVTCVALGQEEWPSPSDHYPIVALFEG